MKNDELIRDLDELADTLATRLEMEEEPVIIWGVCGYLGGWCMSPTGCVIKPTGKVGTVNCKWRAWRHPEYDVPYDELHENNLHSICEKVIVID